MISDADWGIIHSRTNLHPKGLPGESYPDTLDSQVVHEAGVKYDNGKARFDLINPRWLQSIAEVLTHGADKYSENNWKRVDNAHSRYLAAAMRHINAYHQGETYDKESGCPHLTHAACCLMFLYWNDHVNKEGKDVSI